MMTCTPLGDDGLLCYCSDEPTALRLANAVRNRNPRWLVDVVQAYASIAVYFALTQTSFREVKTLVESAADDEHNTHLDQREHRIPCCYDLALDLLRVAQATGLTPEQVIEVHANTPYTVYAIGFAPGFPYLGYLDARISGVPRHDSPRINVEAGSVGLTGRQTGIYTQDRPGGWNIIGRTPLELVNVEDGYFPLRTGDVVRFEPIAKAEYHRQLGERLIL